MAQNHAVIYDRLSKDDLRNPKLRDFHRRECKELAEAHGYTCSDAPDDVFEDRDKSGWKAGVALDGLVATVEAVEAGESDCVVVWAIDRLGRDYDRGYALASRLKAAHCRILSVDDPEYDTTTVEGFHGLMGAFKDAQKSSDRASKRQTDSHVERAEQGIPAGGKSRPFGFKDTADGKRSTEHDPAEVKLIRKAAADVIDGATTYQIAAEWNAAGVKTPSGRQWEASPVKKVLTNPRINGQRVLNGVSYPLGTAVLDDETYTAVYNALSSKATVIRNGEKRKSPLLRGIARCARCEGHPFLVSNGTSYDCKRDKAVKSLNGCGLSINKAWLDEVLSRDARFLLDFPGQLDAVHADTDAERARARELTAARTEKQEKLDEADDHWEEWGSARHSRITKRLTADLAEIAAQLASIRSGSTLDRYVGRGSEWNTFDTDTQRTIIAALLDPVYVLPAEHRGARLDLAATLNRVERMPRRGILAPTAVDWDAVLILRLAVDLSKELKAKYGPKS